MSRKEQILAEAARLFRKNGYEATSMRDIANQLDIEAASLYHHIKSKEEILESICFSMAQKFITASAEVNDIYFSAEEKLRLAILKHVEIICEDIDMSAVFLHEWRSLPEKSFKDFSLLRNHYKNEFIRILDTGLDEDIFQISDKKFAALIILSSVNWINEWYLPEGKMNAKEIADKISDFVLGGLRKKYVTDPNYRP